MSIKIKSILTSACLIVLVVLPLLASAESDASQVLKSVGSMGDNASYQKITTGSNDVAGIVGMIIDAFLGVLGVLFLIYIIYAGYNWMTAQGDEDKVTKAKDTIQRAIIGLIITVAAYAISSWVFANLLTGTGILK